jgi:hypothetical protein
MTGPQPSNVVAGQWLPVYGPQAATSRMGLLASARRPPTPDLHWTGGFAWRPETCLEIQGFNRCDDIESLPAEASDDIVYYQPTAFRVDRSCAIRTYRDVDIDIVRRQADAGTDYAVSHELWTGTESAAVPFVTPTGDQVVNFALADSSATDVTPTVGTPIPSPAEALGLIERAAMEASRGQQVMIHCDYLVAEMSPYNFHTVGDMVFTERGNIVVAASGYDGSGPDGSAAAPGTSWMYATGVVDVRLSDIDVITDPVQTIDRATNIRTIWAQRYFAATFDPCVHFAALVATTALG